MWEFIFFKTFMFVKIEKSLCMSSNSDAYWNWFVTHYTANIYIYFGHVWATFYIDIRYSY